MFAVNIRFWSQWILQPPPTVRSYLLRVSLQQTVWLSSNGWSETHWGCGLAEAQAETVIQSNTSGQPALMCSFMVFILCLTGVLVWAPFQTGLCASQTPPHHTHTQRWQALTLQEPGADSDVVRGVRELFGEGEVGRIGGGLWGKFQEKKSLRLLHYLKSKPWRNSTRTTAE